MDAIMQSPSTFFYKSDSRPTLHMVPEVRLELTRLAAPDPKSDVSTNSTIQAYKTRFGVRYRVTAICLTQQTKSLTLFRDYEFVLLIF